MIKELESKINYLKSLLEEISSKILVSIPYERALPEDLWSKSEIDINIVRKTAEEIRDMMLLLKPERDPSIRKAFMGFIQPINLSIEVLRKPSEQPQENLKQAIEHLRKAVVGGQEFIKVAEDILKNPSEGILEILKLKETYEAKEYISKISVPEAVFTRLEHFKKGMETLKLRILNLEQAVQELLKQMDKLQEEISRFRQP
jgi:hypothetical protein